MASLATACAVAESSCLCGRLFVNYFEKNIGENQPRIGRYDTHKKREYRPIILADRYIGRSLLLVT